MMRDAMEPTEEQLERMQAKANEICAYLEACFAQMDSDGYKWRDLMAGVMFFAIKGMSWCHRHMEPAPDALECVIAQFADGLRATVQANRKNPQEESHGE